MRSYEIRLPRKGRKSYSEKGWEGLVFWLGHLAKKEPALSPANVGVHALYTLMHALKGRSMLCR
jgi:hypothetical protein